MVVEIWIVNRSLNNAFLYKMSGADKSVRF